LVELWQELLNTSPIGIGEDFFALGGHSMLAVQLMAGIERELGHRLPVTALFQHGTIEGLARALRQEVPHPSRSLVPLRTAGSRPPIFWVHPGGGGILSYARLVHHLGPEQPAFAFQARGLFGEHAALDDCTAMAVIYLEELRQQRPEGPYRLGGWSLGGVIAWEMARQLRAAGQTVEVVILLDTYLPGPEAHPERMESLELLTGLALQLGVEPGELALDPRQIRGQSPAELLPALLDQAHEAGVVPREFTLAELQRVYEVFLANLRAAAAYDPQPQVARVLLFQTEDSSADRREQEADRWRRLALGGLQVFTASGDLDSMLSDPHAEPLARQLSTGLEGPGRSTEP
jgi:thioesterase domain-containing protein/acyl carrier protein